MQTILMEIQDTVTKYSNIISKVIDVDVDIVDHQLIRIAGTGVYRESMNESMADEGFIYRATMESGKTQVIEDPCRNPICDPCPQKSTCKEILQISTPIIQGQETLGVIGLVCFNDVQKEHLLSRLEVYLAFIEQIAEFIATKAYEKRENKRTALMIDLMNQVVNQTNMGVIVIDKSERVAHINENAVKQLDLSEPCIGTGIQFTATGDHIGEGEEYKIVINGKDYFLFGSLLDVDFDLEDYTKIIVFHGVNTVKSRIYQLTQVGESIDFSNILGSSEPILELKKKVQKIAASTSTVLIRGESGTGKELFARAIHRRSARRDEPFVAINCGAIPDTLMESELFGYTRGAFTGADPKGRMGKFELANKGTLFLDEIGDIPLYLQAKLLRVLQERKITRIGSNNQIDVDVRIIAATHKNLAEMIREKSFREDLYYRLNVIPLEIPPLRARHADIELLAQHFINKYSQLFGKFFRRLDPEALECLIAYSWPGNVRELENNIEFMVNMMDADGVLSKNMLPRSILNQLQQPGRQAESDPVRTIQELEMNEIHKALKVYGLSSRGKKVAAQKLGIGIATLYRKLEGVDLSK